MSYAIDAAAGYVPVFGVDVAITGKANHRVVGYEFGGEAKVIEWQDGLGDTRTRIFHDMEQSKTLSLDVFATGTDEAGAATANTPTPATIGDQFNAGTAIVLTSTKHPSVAGTWRITRISATGSNSAPVSWRLECVPELT